MISKRTVAGAASGTYLWSPSAVLPGIVSYRSIREEKAGKGLVFIHTSLQLTCPRHPYSDGQQIRCSRSSRD